MPETPEQKARRDIDAKLAASGWIVQDKKAIDFNAGPGIAIREYQTARPHPRRAHRKTKRTRHRFSPAGRIEDSPRFQPWEKASSYLKVPKGRLKTLIFANHTGQNPCPAV